MNVTGFALGMIETLGVPALIAAADAAAKAADVTIMTYEKADAGIVTVYIIGDVASVQAAVSVGEAEAQRVGRLLRSHVIARPDQNVQKMMARLLRSKTGCSGEQRQHTQQSTEAKEPMAVTSPSEGAEWTMGSAETDGSVSVDAEAPSEWKRKSISELRKMALSCKGFPLSAEEINSAKKEELIRLLIETEKERGEENT
ncbi:hypothetical protein DNHGIG_30300 [Collibacillus ludicampi]|uniref:BMC domain-containing protein n=1 Tax=Collibacillus ludicampi TaxID=2771369 RepID=A0AAV4LI19_9BACL|nr:BMC domain-containing protein [Collibacillus ludicampi]GIM47481.1 hypothetical protein DNHGIG_30300 [Collibacillus ludicampi]